MTSNAKLYEMIIKAEKESYAPEYITAIKTAIEDNIREENAKSSGNKKELTIIKAMQKKTAPNLAGYYEMNDGFFGFTDGKRILASRDNFGMSKSEKEFNIDDMLNTAHVNHKTIEIKIDIADAKTWADTHKKEFKPYTIKYAEKCYIGVDAAYLVDMLQFCKTDTIVINEYYKNRYGCDFCSYNMPMSASGEEKKALLLPVSIAIEPQTVNVDLTA